MHTRSERTAERGRQHEAHLRVGAKRVQLWVKNQFAARGLPLRSVRVACLAGECWPVAGGRSPFCWSEERVWAVAPHACCTRRVAPFVCACRHHTHLVMLAWRWREKKRCSPRQHWLGRPRSDEERVGLLCCLPSPPLRSVERAFFLPPPLPHNRGEREWPGRHVGSRTRFAGHAALGRAQEPSAAGLCVARQRPALGVTQRTSLCRAGEPEAQVSGAAD